MRKFMAVRLVVMLATGMLFAAGAQEEKIAAIDLQTASWDEIVDAAKGEGEVSSPTGIWHPSTGTRLVSSMIPREYRIPRRPLRNWNSGSMTTPDSSVSMILHEAAQVSRSSIR